VNISQPKLRSEKFDDDDYDNNNNDNNNNMMMMMKGRYYTDVETSGTPDREVTANRPDIIIKHKERKHDC